MNHPSLLSSPAELRAYSEELSDRLEKAEADAKLIDRMELHGAQVWHEKGKWTIFLHRPNALPLQPSADSLRGVIRAAMSAEETP